MKRFGKLILMFLKELADENSYSRHLQQCGRPHSPEEWRKFCDRRLRAKYLRAKCC
jgi:hypothetical protein